MTRHNHTNHSTHTLTIPNYQPYLKFKSDLTAPGKNIPGGSTSDTLTIAQHALNSDLPSELDDWELSEGGLPEGSTLSGSKALLDGPPEDEAD